MTDSGAPAGRPPGRSRPADALRPVAIETGYLARVPASVVYASGLTRVLCTATLEEVVPPFLLGRGRGWSTAEYDLLPAATVPRHPRERTGKLSGRTQEIQRLIGRSMRAVLDLTALGERTLKLDCDVIEADGGTRTAAINGAWVAAAIALEHARTAGRIDGSPLTGKVTAISVGLVDGSCLLDLDQAEDNRADVDFNVVMTDRGALVELQGTAEGTPFDRGELDALLDIAQRGIVEIAACQEEALRAALSR